MTKSNKILGIIVVLLLLSVAYLVIRPNQTHRTVLSENANGQVSPMKENFMVPHLPTALTDQQKAELKLGSGDHKPTNLTFNVTGGSFYFTPNEIKVKQGDKVTIIFNDVGGMHNFTLDAFNVATKTINTGESDTIQFTANKKGTFEFYCSVGGGYHRMMGQIGVLIVE